MPNSFSDRSPAPNDASMINDLPRLSRRRFGQHAALAAALSLSPAELLTAPHHSHRQGHDSIELTSEQAENVEARLADIIRKYGSRLSEEQRKHLRRMLSYNERMLASVCAFRLQNSDSPASVLKISFAPQTPPATKGGPSTEDGKL
jgi:hypothetical protein